MISIQDVELELDRIEKMQEEVQEILHHKNPIVRFFKLNKALKIHNEAHEAMEKLFSRMKES